VLISSDPAWAQRNGANVITVNTDEDESNTDGDCSLREAITAADTNAAVDACDTGSATQRDAIHFSLGPEATIILDSELPPVTDTSGLNINGLEAKITVSGDDSVQVLQVGLGAKLTLHNLTVAHGSAETGFAAGGGALNNGGTLRVDHSTFSNNSALFGGGIQNSNAGTLKVINSSFSDNSALEGGGIRNGSGTLEVTNSTLSGNSSTGNPGFGGGIENNNVGTATVTKSTLSNNTTAMTSGSGAGIENIGGTLTVTNSTLSGNNRNGATSGSAGIDNNQGTLNVISSTFSNNGVRDEGSATSGTTLSNTILANVPSPGNNCVGTVIDDGYNISDDETCNFTETTSENGTDPKLASMLANNGGPTQTIALLMGSPALNAIPKATNGCGTEIKTDQRGVMRPQGKKCDIGAYEKKRDYILETTAASSILHL